MTTKKTNHPRSNYANLIKYRDPESEDFVWFWVHPSSGGTLSPHFKTRSEAEKWFNDIIRIHNETSDLIKRAKDGKIYKLKAAISIEDTIILNKAQNCPFVVYLEENVITVEVLALSERHAKERLEEYFEIIQWIEE